MAKFPDIVRIYQIDDESGSWTMLYETAANVQETNAGSKTGGVEISDFVAYCENNSMTFSSANCRLDWFGFNREFSDNYMDWFPIKKNPFNYEKFGTVIYFDNISN